MRPPPLIRTTSQLPLGGQPNWTASTVQFSLSLTSSVYKVHELLAEIPGVGPLLEGPHDEVGLRVREVLVEGEDHVEEGVGELFLVVVAHRVLNAVQEEHDVVHIPLV